MTRHISIKGGNTALVDDIDYEWLSQYKWHLHNRGYVTCAPQRNIKLYMHRMIMRPSEDNVVDHIDGNKLNNTRANLRICNHRDNSRNAHIRANGTSKYKGVYWSALRGYWVARINNTHLGCFHDEVEAAKAYDRAARSSFGAFARLNFPDF